MDMNLYLNDGYLTIIAEAVFGEGNSSISDVTDYLLTSLTLKK